MELRVRTLSSVWYYSMESATWRFLIRLNLQHIVIGRLRFCAAVARLRVPFILACGKYRWRLKNLNIQFKAFQLSKQQQTIQSGVELMLNIAAQIKC